MGSPFYNKNKSKLRKPVKTEMLDEVNLGSIGSKPKKEKRYGSAPEPSVAPRNNVQQVLRKPLENFSKDKSIKPKMPKLPEMIQRDYTPNFRPLPSPPKAKEFPIKNNEKSVPILEAYTPPQFEGAKPLAQSNQKRIYSTFKEQMEQLKNK